MYESGNEVSDDNTVEQLNKEIKQREDEAERTRLNTIHQMEINRETAAKKEADEVKKREYLKNLSEALGVNQIREETDKLNLSVNHLAEKSQEMIDQLNQITKILSNGNTETAPIIKADPMVKLEALSQLIQPLAEAYKLFKGEPQQESPLIDSNTIKEKMVKNFYDNLETGESINDFIKNSLKKTVTKKIVQSALSEIGNNGEIEHGPL